MLVTAIVAVVGGQSSAEELSSGKGRVLLEEDRQQWDRR